MTFKKWLSVFVYLLTSCAFGMNIFVVLLLYGVSFFFWAMFDVPFEIHIDDLIKYSKAATFSGIIVAVGCWWIYYQGYKKNRNR